MCVFTDNRENYRVFPIFDKYIWGGGGRKAPVALLLRSPL